MINYLFPKCLQKFNTLSIKLLKKIYKTLKIYHISKCSIYPLQHPFSLHGKQIVFVLFVAAVTVANVASMKQQAIYTQQQQ